MGHPDGDVVSKENDFHMRVMEAGTVSKEINPEERGEDRGNKREGERREFTGSMKKEDKK